MQELNEGLDLWEKKLTRMAGGPRPFEYTTEDVQKKIYDEWGKQIMKSKEARSYLSEDEIESFYEAFRKDSKRGSKGDDYWNTPVGESLAKTSGKVIIERLKKTLRDPLNGKTSIQMDRR